jgi:hypothetical protein
VTGSLSGAGIEISRTLFRSVAFLNAFAGGGQDLTPEQTAVLLEQLPKAEYELVPQRSPVWYEMRRMYLVTGASAFRLLLCGCGVRNAKYGTGQDRRTLRLPSYRKGTVVN